MDLQSQGSSSKYPLHSHRKSHAGPMLNNNYHTSSQVMRQAPNRTSLLLQQSKLNTSGSFDLEHSSNR